MTEPSDGQGLSARITAALARSRELKELARESCANAAEARDRSLRARQGWLALWRRMGLR